MRVHGVEGASTGSPREILQMGYKIGFKVLKDTLVKKLDEVESDWM